MPTTFNLPDLGEGLQEAEIVEWKVKEGDTVKVDDPLVAVETDKAVVDVPSPYNGKIKKLHWANGDIVPTHSALVDFDEVDGAAPEADEPQQEEKKAQADDKAKPAPKKAVGGKKGGSTFNLPDLGEGLQEAEIVEWKVSVGDKVKVDDPLVAVETDKAVVDVPSPYEGEITALHWENGDIVPTHSALCDFKVEGDGSDDAADEPETKEVAMSEDSGTVVGKMATSDADLEETVVIRKGKGAKRERKAKPRPAPAQSQAQAKAFTPPVNITHGTGKPKASPATRAYAKECGCDLTQVPATGSKGQITKADVDAFMNSGGAQQQAQPQSMGMGGMSVGGGWDVPPHAEGVTFGPQQLKGPRRAMHKSMTAARSQVMECTLFDDADIHGWMPGQDITARIIRAVVAGCRTVPQMNAWYDGDKMEMTIHQQVDLAMAVDTPDGLIVPVIRNADTKNGQQLREDLNIIKHKTRAREVAPEDMKNPTITLSNFGMMAGRYATPVVVPPQVAILGTGGLRHDVVPVMGGVETHKRVPLSITFDHRCLTGGEACRWLAAVIKDLEKPY
ncbi:MAG: 2-oxo acid dehydrogenase subunit E2 [Gammaproteobacteria bacterium]|nr:2-oxo acid dehydrogenase subunit E2 [Gammaproteobacteria bacterium]